MHGWIKGGAQNNEPTGERGGFLFFMALFSLGVFVMIAYLFPCFLGVALLHFGEFIYLVSFMRA